MMSILLSLVATMSLQAIGETVSDETLKDESRRFLRPVECVEMIRGQPRRPPVLTEKISFDGDTNRLARILVEVAQTNNAWYSEMAMRELVKYGTAEQLPFLYSCVTNPAIGDLAVKTVLRIEGITSNSVSSAQRYFALTNVPDSVDRSRTSICADLITLSGLDGVDASWRSNAMEVAAHFIAAPDCNAYWLDRLLLERDASYQHSKRRLANLRNSVAYATQWDFIYNYVTNAINELVAYPEADLPD